MHFAERENEIAYGCLFCKSGQEKRLAVKLAERWPEVEFIAPEKKRIRRKGDCAIEETVVLFPGYIFIKAASDLAVFVFLNMENVYRVLMDSDKNWRLRGADRALVKRLFELGGVVGLSTAYYVGDRIRIADGFLKDYQGEILRVNRRKRTVQVRMKIDDREMLIWLGFELLDQTNEENRNEGE